MNICAGNESLHTAGGGKTDQEKQRLGSDKVLGLFTRPNPGFAAYDL